MYELELYELKIIDVEILNESQIRLYLGDPHDTDYHGDDWDDAPFEYNAEIVDDRYIADVLDVMLPGYQIKSIADVYGENSPICKLDLRDNKYEAIRIYDEYGSLVDTLSYNVSVGVGLDNDFYEFETDNGQMKITMTMHTTTRVSKLELVNRKSSTRTTLIKED